MCNTRGSTDTDYIQRENEMEYYDFFILSIYYVCVWYLIYKL